VSILAGRRRLEGMSRPVRLSPVTETILLAGGLGFVVLVFVVLFVGVAVSFSKAKKRDLALQRLRTNGVAAKARIRSADVQPSAHVSSSLTVRLGLEVHPPFGPPYFCQTTATVPFLQASTLQIGAWGEVRVEPQAPQQVAWMGVTPAHPV